MSRATAATEALGLREAPCIWIQAVWVTWIEEGSVRILAARKGVATARRSPSSDQLADGSPRGCDVGTPFPRPSSRQHK